MNLLNFKRLNPDAASCNAKRKKLILCFLLCFPTLIYAQEVKWPVYENGKIVGNLYAETTFDGDSCYTLDTLDILGQPVVIRLEVSYLGYSDTTYRFSRDIDFYKEIKLNKNEFLLKFRSTLGAETYELYFRKENGTVYIDRKQWFYPRSFVNKEIAEGGCSAFSCTHIYNKIINKKMEEQISFSDLFFNEPSDDIPENCFACPRQYSREECIEMKTKNMEFVWISEETDTVQTDTPLFNPDTAYRFQLPMGNPDILKRWENEERITEIYDSYIINQMFCDSFLCGNTIPYDSIMFNEINNDNYYCIHIYKEPTEAVVSKKMLQKNGCDFYLAYAGYSKNVKIFLLSVKKGLLIDSKRIYYHQEGESGFTRGQLFFIDENMNLSFREYQFADEGDIQSPILSQWLVNTEGRFVQYYENDGVYKTEKERGLIKNHYREGLWVEKKGNGLSSERFSTGEESHFVYLESEYRAGVPVGEWRYYRLDTEYGKSPLSGKKGELIYTEIYENGKLKERIFEK